MTRRVEMPLYEYRCGACGNAFERYAAGGGAQAVAEECPKCGKPNVKKVFSTFASNACCSGQTAGGAGGAGGCGGGSGQFS
jgi:putative FmdB family regulatory protein